METEAAYRLWKLVGLIIIVNVCMPVGKGSQEKAARQGGDDGPKYWRVLCMLEHNTAWWQH